MKKFYFIIAILVFFGCTSNRPNGYYEFITADGDKRSFNFISDSTVVITVSEIGSKTGKYKIENKSIIISNLQGEEDLIIHLMITEDGLQLDNGDLYVKKNDTEQNLSNQETNKSSTESNDNDTDEVLLPEQQESKDKFTNLLMKYIFIKQNGLTSLMSFQMTSPDNYEFKVVAMSGYGTKTVVNVRGNYEVMPSTGLDEAEIILFPDKIQKSPLYDTFDEIELDIFIYSNLKFTIREFNKNDLNKYAEDNVFLAQSAIDENKIPEYVLDGDVVFYSEKILTQAEKDSIADKENNDRKKREELEEKLNGF